MKIFRETDNVYDAVDAVVDVGVAAVLGTKTPATMYCERIVRALEPYSDVEPAIGYRNVQGQGYLYYVYDTARFSSGDFELARLVDEMDRSS